MASPENRKRGEEVFRKMKEAYDHKMQEPMDIYLARKRRQSDRLSWFSLIFSATAWSIVAVITIIGLLH